VHQDQIPKQRKPRPVLTPVLRNLMSIEDTIGYRNRVLTCVVCGKNVENGGGFAKIKRGEVMLELCCPLCLETFQKSPEPFLKRAKRIGYFRELSELQQPIGSAEV
jgi:hypothetical protein